MPSETSEPVQSKAAEKALLHNGKRIETSEDAARFFGVRHHALLYTLYKASEEERYRAFEIPKRSGGMRQIHAPVGMVRDLQDKLSPIIRDAYEAHPSAHGFIPARSIVSNAKAHAGQKLVLNIDLADFFPSINFGRIRGLFMASPFSLGPGAATVFAQLCIHRNGLPQGAPTSPSLSNFIAATLDRRLTRLAKQANVRYSRYADDITLSTNQNTFPANIAIFEQVAEEGKAPALRVRPGDALERAILASGFDINHKKVRLHTRHQRQSVTGLNVNTMPNLERTRVRRIRAMLHAWAKFGLDAAASEHFLAHRGFKALPNNAGQAYRNIVYGEISFLKMVRGPEHPIFLNFCAKLLELDPKPSRFVRQIAFGDADFDVFISHASEDKETIARPIFEACQRIGLKAFFDEAHIGWGQSFTQKINTALGAAPTVLAVISSTSVSKDWPVTEVNAALAMEVSRQKKVVPLIVGKPDLSRLPLIATKDCLDWKGDADAVAKRLLAAKTGDAPRRPAEQSIAPLTAAPSPKPAPVADVGASNAGPWAERRDEVTTPSFMSVPQFEEDAEPEPPRKRSFWEVIFGRRKTD